MRCAALTFIVIAGSSPVALAVDLTTKAPEYKPAAALSYDWSGPYAGLNVGGAWARAETGAEANSIFSAPGAFPQTSAFIAANQPTLTPHGFTGGLQFGYNWQRDRWLWGVEADINYLGLSRSYSFEANPVPGTIANLAVDGRLSTQYLATLRPRVGYVFDRWMIYGTAGLAVTTQKLKENVSVAAAGGGTFNASSSQTKLGWTIGAGTEWVVVPNVTAKVEYLYADLGKATTTAPYTGNLPGAEMSFSSRLTANIIRFGLSYKFGSSK